MVRDIAWSQPDGETAWIGTGLAGRWEGNEGYMVLGSTDEDGWPRGRLSRNCETSDGFRWDTEPTEDAVG